MTTTPTYGDPKDKKGGKTGEDPARRSRSRTTENGPTKPPAGKSGRTPAGSG